MDFKRVASLDEIPVGQSKIVEVEGREIALFNAGGQVFAIDNCCPHRGGPLGEGTLEGTEVTCPWHGWKFDVTTGRNVTLPTKHTDTFEVKVENSEVFVGTTPNPQNEK